MVNKHRWFNYDDTRRCTYCDIRWHPSRDTAECRAEFPIKSDEEECRHATSTVE